MPRESSSSQRGRGECEKAERTELSDEDRGKREEHTHVFAASCLVSRLRTEFGKSQLLQLVASPNIGRLRTYRLEGQWWRRGCQRFPAPLASSTL
jgi:hypothetical protein